MLKIIKKNKLFLPNSTVATTKLIQAVKSELAIPNPAYEDAARFGYSTRGIPKVIRAYRENKGKLELPRGYEDRLLDLLEWFRLPYTLEDETTCFPPEKNLRGKIKLWDYQQPWVAEMLQYENGIGVGSCGSGKTVMALDIYARLGQPCLWITHTKRLANQTARRATSFLGIETGFIGSGKEDVEHFTVALVQTLAKRDLRKYVDKFGLIIVDECQHTPADSFFSVISQFSARHLYGLTATPYREDGLEALMFHSLGLQRAYLDKAMLRGLGKLMTPTVVRRPTRFSFPYNSKVKKYNYNAVEAALPEDEARNQAIVVDILVEATRDPNNVCIVLISRIAHGKKLYDKLSEIVSNTAFVHSKISDKKIEEYLNGFEAGEYKILIATYEMLAEGFDYPPANRLFLTGPIKARSAIEQACGRVERVHTGKKDVFIYDYIDEFVSVLKRQAETRLDIYEQNGNPTYTTDLV